jgi:Family of unknown function (DUF6298)/Putative collagen-binding domain of a collagenase
MHRRDLLKSTVGFAAASALAAVPPQTRWLQEVPGYDPSPAPARGPLRVLPENPRYFTDGSGKAIFLTGSHTWENFQDIGLPPVPRFDYRAYLEMMIKHNHNFMRFWHWLQAAYAPWTKDKILFAPLPYMRTGPGTARDGLPKFDLTKFNPAYFERMHSRIAEARDRGIYCAVQLFQSFSERKKDDSCDPWVAHSYNGANNINHFDAEKPGTGTVDLQRSDVREMQAKYLQRIIDTVADLDNVLYEVINEGGNKDWDWWVVDFMHQHEAEKGKVHPVGLTGWNAETLDQMRASPAEWISIGGDQGQFWKTDPPAWDGKKVSVLDTDHLWGHGGTPSWAWKSFVRGHNTLLMDAWDPIPGRPCGLQNWATRPGYPTRDLNRRHDWTWEPVRKAMGNTRTLAKRVDLAAMTPHNELVSTKYCLANPGVEYIVYAPEGDEFTLDLSSAPGEFRAEWLHPVEGTIIAGGSVKGGQKPNLAVPFPGAATFYLHKS